MYIASSRTMLSLGQDKLTRTERSDFAVMIFVILCEIVFPKIPVENPNVKQHSARLRLLCRPLFRTIKYLWECQQLAYFLLPTSKTRPSSRNFGSVYKFDFINLSLLSVWNHCTNCWSSRRCNFWRHLRIKMLGCLAAGRNGAFSLCWTHWAVWLNGLKRYGKLSGIWFTRTEDEAFLAGFSSNFAKCTDPNKVILPENDGRDCCHPLEVSRDWYSSCTECIALKSTKSIERPHSGKGCSYFALISTSQPSGTLRTSVYHPRVAWAPIGCKVENVW